MSKNNSHKSSENFIYSCLSLILILVVFYCLYFLSTYEKNKNNKTISQSQLSIQMQSSQDLIIKGVTVKGLSDWIKTGYYPECYRRLALNTTNSGEVITSENMKGIEIQCEQLKAQQSYLLETEE